MVRMAPAADEVGDGDPLGRDGRLRQQPQHARKFPRGHPVDGLPVQQHLSLPGIQKPRHRPQQGGLAAGIGTDNGSDPTGRDGKAQPLDDQPLAIARAEVPRDEVVIDGHSEAPVRFARMMR